MSARSRPFTEGLTEKESRGLATHSAFEKAAHRVEGTSDTHRSFRRVHGSAGMRAFCQLRSPGRRVQKALCARRLVSLPTVAPPGFSWRTASWGQVLACDELERWATHIFTTRELDVRAANATPAASWEAVARHMGVQPTRVLRLQQVHGAAAIVWTSDAEPSAVLGAADIAITSRSDVALVVQAADCVPILLADTKRRAVAVVHAGWRGTVSGAARRAVQIMGERLGVDAAELVAALGPSIGPCCYEVGGDVPQTFEDGGFTSEERQQWLRRDASGRLTLDLWRANADQLRSAGVRADRILVAGLCTATHVDVFPSHRAERGGANRLIGCIRLRAPVDGGE